MEQRVTTCRYQFFNLCYSITRKKKRKTKKKQDKKKEKFPLKKKKPFKY